MEPAFQKILNDYRKADENKRLHIYLQVPHLRDTFYQIDQENSQNEAFDFRGKFNRTLRTRLLSFFNFNT